jgi:hypothetical protein
MELLVGADPPHRRRLVEQQVAGEHDALAGHVHDDVTDLVGWAEVDQVNLHAPELEHMPLIEERGRRHGPDPIEVVGLVQLLRRRQQSRVGGPQQGASGEMMHGVRELLAFRGIGCFFHPLLHRAVGDDVGPRKELVAGDVVDVLVGEGNVSWHSRPDPTEQLDHLPGVRQVRLSVDDQTIGQVDEP